MVGRSVIAVLLVVMLIGRTVLGQDDRLYSYICMAAQDKLCLAISTPSPPKYTHGSLYDVQVKLRYKIQEQGQDYLKTRWSVYPSTSLIQLANFTTLCISKRLTSTTTPGDVVLRPCDSTATPELWDLDSFVANEQGGTQLRLKNYPTQCLTLMACTRVTTSRGVFCNVNPTAAYAGATMDPSLLKGAYVKMMPCKDGLQAQLFTQTVDCAPGCNPLQEEPPCDPHCANDACNWQNGICATPRPTPPTYVPTTSPTKKPTHLPTLSPSVSSPTKNPTRLPTKKHTHSPTMKRTESPTLIPTHRPSLSPSFPTSQPSTSPTNRTMTPSSSPIVAAATLVPVTSVPSSSPSASPTGSPTSQPTTSPLPGSGGAPGDSSSAAPSTAPLNNSTDGSPNAIANSVARRLWYVWLIIIVVVLILMCCCVGWFFGAFARTKEDDRYQDIEADGADENENEIPMAKEVPVVVAEKRPMEDEMAIKDEEPIAKKPNPGPQDEIPGGTQVTSEGDSVSTMGANGEAPPTVTEEVMEEKSVEGEELRET